MAITYTDNGGGAPNGSDKEFTYTFPVIQTEDVKVALNGVTQATTKYTVDNVSNPTHIEFNNTSIDSSVQESSGAPKSGVRVRVYRETTVGKANGDEDPKAVFAAGSSIRAIDLNANQEQALMAIHELQTRPIETEDIQNDAITNVKIADDQIDSEHYVAGSIDHEHLANDIIDGDNIQDDVINSEHYVADSIDTEHYAPGSVDNTALGADAVNGDKIANDSIDSEHYVDGSIDEQHIANSAVTSNKIADNAVTTTEILNGAVTRAKLEADIIDGTKLADNAVDSEHYTDGSIDRVHLEADIIDSTKLADNAVNSEHYVDGSIDREHLEADIIDSTKLADNAVGNEHLQTDSVRTAEIQNDAVTIDKIADAAIVTNSEQASHSVDDNTFFTTAAAEARYFNASTGETIKDGQTFPDNDTTIATTAAINDRIIDLVDDVGGFVPIANETSFPTTNPDVNNGTGTIVSVSAASTNLAPSGTTVTIANGAGTGNTVTITGVSSTIPSGFGFLVETTTTLHTYTFHRLSPKATEVTTVAGKATEIGRLGTADAVADMAILGTADVVADLNTLGTADVVADMNLLATSDVVSDMNTLAVTSVVNNMDTVAGAVTNVNNVGGSIANVNTTAGSIANVNTVAGSISNVNTVGGAISNVNTTAGSISNVNTVASNISNVNNFANQYRIGSSNPTTSLDTGDLFFNTSTNSLKVYTGSAWVDGVTQTGNFALKTGNTFTGDNTYTDAAKALFGTGGDLMLFHNGTTSYLDNNTGDLRINTASGEVQINKATSEYMARFKVDGAVELYYDNSLKFKTTSTGALLGDHTVANVGTLTKGVLDLGAQYSNTDGTPKLFLYNDTNAYLGFGISSNQLDVCLSASGYDFVTYAGTTELFRVEGTGNVQIPADNKKLQIGANQDLELFKDGNHVRIKDNQSANGYATCINTDHFRINDLANNENMARFIKDGAAELFYDHTKRFHTRSNGVEVTGSAFIRAENANDSILLLYADDGDDHDDLWRLRATDSGSNFHLDNYASSSWETNIKAIGNGAVELYHNNIKTFETVANGIIAKGTEGADAFVYIFADEADDVADQYWLKTAADGTGLYIQNYVSGSTETNLRAVGNGAVELYHNNVKMLETTSTGISTAGAITAVGGTFNGDVQLTGDNYNVYWDKSENTLEFKDDAILAFGDNDDFTIKHVGSDSTTRLIETSGGSMFIQAGNFVVTNPAGNEFMINGAPDGSVSLYYDSAKKAETTSTGLTVSSSSNAEVKITGATSGAATLEFGDTDNDDEANISYDNYNGFMMYRTTANADMRFYTNGTHRLTLHKTGYLAPAADSTYDIGTSSVRFANGYFDTLYGDGSNLTGISSDLVDDTSPQLGGNLDANSKTISFGDSSSSSNNRIKFGTTDNDLQIYHDGTNSRVAEGGTGNLMLTTAGSQVHLYNTSNSEDLAKFISNGAVELYNDNSKKFETTTTGAKITGSGNHSLLLSGSMGSAEHFKIQNDTSGAYIQIGMQQNDTDGLHHRAYIRAQKGSGSIAGKLELLARGSGGGTDRGWIIDAGVGIQANTSVLPETNNSYNLGSSSLRWANIFTNDLNLSNEGGANDVDGTWGNWTIQEGESDLFLKNNRSGKKYKFNLTEVV